MDHLKFHGLIGVAILLSGCQQIKSLWRGPTAIVSADRTPASIEKPFDFSYLQGDALKVASQKRLFESIAIELDRKKEVATISMGNFVVVNEVHQKDFACGFFSHLSLEFEADGVSVNGEKPKMILETICEIGDNINALAPIHLPISKMNQLKPTNSELKFFEGKFPLTVRFQGMPPQWPKFWVLREVKMTNPKFAPRTLSVRASDWMVKDLKSITMKW